MTQQANTAPELLTKAASIMAERGKQYDKPAGERSMRATVAAFNAVTGKALSEADGWLLLALLKMVRDNQRDAAHRDSCEDLIAYCALYGESRLMSVDAVLGSSEWASMNFDPLFPAVYEVRGAGMSSSFSRWDGLEWKFAATNYENATGFTSRGAACYDGTYTHWRKTNIEAKPVQTPGAFSGTGGTLGLPTDGWRPMHIQPTKPALYMMKTHSQRPHFARWADSEWKCSSANQKTAARETTPSIACYNGDITAWREITYD